MYLQRSISGRPILLVFLCLVALQLRSQTIPVGAPITEDYIRRMQLTGKTAPSRSLMIRPIHLTDTLTITDSGAARDFAFLEQWRSGGAKTVLFNRKLSIGALPVTIDQQYNTHHPYGWNDGAMIPARGYQTMVSAGFYAKAGPLTVQFKPEMVWAENKAFETFPTNHYDVTWANYYYFLNRIDNPERFGTKAYSKLLPGQSSIRLNYKALSVGLSTENLWWGPGMRNSLLMSNHAPGFGHLTFNTTRPIRSGIGSFEFQVIAGRLNASGILPPETNRVYNGSFLYSAKPVDWRYINGAVVTWQPKWTPGLFLGASRTYYVYRGVMGNTFSDYIPVFATIFKAGTTNDDAKQRDQLASLFLRWVMPKENAELYFEYGRNDFSLNLRDLSLSPEHSRAYIVGFRKLLELRNKAWLQIASEVTQTESSATARFRQQEGWYRHYQVRDGYTNQGQVLGAGIGPGSNSQMISFTYHKGVKSVGLMFERLVHDNDFFYQAFVDSRDFRRYWIDVSTVLTAEWAMKRFLLSGKMALVRSLNYEWWLVQTSTAYFANGYDVLNLHGKLSLSYRF